MKAVGAYRAVQPLDKQRLRPNLALLLGVLPLVVTLSIFFVWPIGKILVASVYDGGFTLANYRHILETRVYGRVLLNTVFIAGITTLGTLVLSFPLAYLMATAKPRFNKLLTFAILLPFWTSALIRTTAWIILLQRNGMLNKLLLSTGITSQPIAFVYNLSGVLIGMIHVLMPFMVLPLYTAFRSIDRNLLDAAESMGARPVQRFFRIMVPLTAPGIAAGGLIVFMNALGYFITPSLLGGPKQQMISELISYNILEQLNWGMAAALAVLLLAVTLVLFYVFQRFLGLEKLLSSSGVNSDDNTLGNAKGEIKRSWVEKVLAIGAVCVALFLVLPNLVIIPMSFSPAPFHVFPPEAFTFKWFTSFFSGNKWVSALRNSLEVACIAVALASLLGTAAAIGMARLKAQWKGLAEAYFLLPMIVPGVIYAISLYYFYAPLGLVGSKVGLAVAHALLGAPFVYLTVSAALRSFDKNLELAARGLGASELVILVRIVLPRIVAGIVSGAVFAFIVSFDDVLVSLFVTNIRSRTLPKVMYEAVSRELDPTITAIATILIGVAVAVLLVTMLPRRRKESVA